MPEYVHPDYKFIRETLVKKVLPDLKAAGLYPRASFGSTQTSGLYAICKLAEGKGKSRGVVFWTTQGNDRFRESGELYLYINHSAESSTPQQTVEVGKAVVEACERHGLKTEWDGSSAQAVRVFLFK